MFQFGYWFRFWPVPSRYLLSKICHLMVQFAYWFNFCVSPNMEQLKGLDSTDAIGNIDISFWDKVRILFLALDWSPHCIYLIISNIRYNDTVSSGLHTVALFQIPVGVTATNMDFSSRGLVFPKKSQCRHCCTNMGAFRFCGPKIACTACLGFTQSFATVRQMSLCSIQDLFWCRCP